MSEVHELAARDDAPEWSGDVDDYVRRFRLWRALRRDARLTMAEGTACVVAAIAYMQYRGHLSIEAAAAKVAEVQLAGGGAS